MHLHAHMHKHKHTRWYVCKNLFALIWKHKQVHTYHRLQTISDTTNAHISIHAQTHMHKQTSTHIPTIMNQHACMYQRESINMQITTCMQKHTCNNMHATTCSWMLVHVFMHKFCSNMHTIIISRAPSRKISMLSNACTEKHAHTNICKKNYAKLSSHQHACTNTHTHTHTTTDAHINTKTLMSINTLTTKNYSHIKGRINMQT